MAVTAMAGGTGNNQHKISSKDTVVVVTAMETAAAGTVTTATGAPTTAPGVGAVGIAFTTAAGTETTAMGAAQSAASAARTAWHFWWGVAHIVQSLPPLFEEVHAPNSQSEAEEEEAMMGGLWVLVVMVVCRVVHAGCVCAASPCCFVRLTRISAPKNWQTMANWGSPESSQ
jgi:hypothetical protein